MSNAGLLTGIRNVTQGRSLDVKPYLVATSESFPGRGDSGLSNDANVGADLFYNLTPQLRANLTVNTDFAQAEVDARQVNLHPLRTTNPLDTGRSSAFGGELALPNDPLNARTGDMEVEENYDAAVGFSRRTGFRNINPLVTFSPRPRQHPWLRRFNFGGDMKWFLRPADNRLLTREIDLTAFQVDLHSQHSIQFHVVPTYELLEEDFPIAPELTLPLGRAYSSRGTASREARPAAARWRSRRSGMGKLLFGGSRPGRVHRQPARRARPDVPLANRTYTLDRRLSSKVLYTHRF
jgi:hypothetical protein